MSPGPETFWRDGATDRTLHANPDARLFSPSAERNAEAILAVLAVRLPAEGRLLEIASGTGQHALWLSQRMPGLFVQPSDPSEVSRRSIAAWTVDAPRVAPPIFLDVADPQWPASAGSLWDAILAVNLVHIAPWQVTCGLMRGAAAVLAPAGQLFLYGCFSVGGAHVAESNALFDESLRAQDPAWGVRAVEDVAAEAGRYGFAHRETVAMPANNMTLVFARGDLHPGDAVRSG